MVDVWNPGTQAMNYTPPNQSKDTAEKVLRRAHIARVVTNLKSRLALATFKTQRGLESCNFEALEALTLVNNDGSPPSHSESSSPKLNSATINGPGAARFEPSPKHTKSPVRNTNQLFDQKNATESMPPPPLPGYSPDKRDFTAYAGAAQHRRQVFNNSLSRGSPVRQQTVLPSLGAAMTPTTPSAPRHRKRAKTLEQGGNQWSAPRGGMPQSMSMPNGLQSSLHQNEDGPAIEPSTPPPQSGPIPALPSTPTSQQLRGTDQEGANLLLYLATSPGRNTPRTPDFHLNEYCNIFTPSPGGNHVPHPMTPSSINRARQHLNFET
ncbi:hypothetical protein B9G98_03555 [Wickerhamiella sorbophila]|uniref:Uncharacterized protein n=1 Tax=Wickerhamiella sorbophila TaxID=45607 RepID=A0A2T0FLT2_9ASCO|nr:hypothetical protein B9G98_03555 [Wickerhamiella sorbophila]PRT55935.1 hypothetical protein B9G98_03555 [Wickerhamiella sorbophila]